MMKLLGPAKANATNFAVEEAYTRARSNKGGHMLETTKLKDAHYTAMSALGYTDEEIEEDFDKLCQELEVFYDTLKV